ncbi:Arsenical pump-driving ATPase [Labilithrix luteola]|uniref:arsenite-transporting ATPase n=1 Tax=Labilithrix luteola TaxID=1391654 RepID=A0A0K1PRU2_9BACT|nr:arsenical pump-driving ATPase [Labilithrix luteola]AKU96243.1 Arsenical pump-driving ATPase [Labilithrix luteola]
MKLLEHAPRNLFFTGKGGVGKTSTACAVSLALAARGRRVLLVSTDPASNLAEVLDAPVGAEISSIEAFPTLRVLNIDPEIAAARYRDRALGPYRELLPEAAVRSIEEQFSGACTVEIAAFEEFAKLVVEGAGAAEFDHVVFDTAPTGHTLRLLELPAAWGTFLATNTAGSSCLGPLAGLHAQRQLYEDARAALSDPERTVVVLVARPDSGALAEAKRTLAELEALGIRRQELVVNGVFRAAERADEVAFQMETMASKALSEMPSELRALPRTEVPLLGHGIVGSEALQRLRGLLEQGDVHSSVEDAFANQSLEIRSVSDVPSYEHLDDLITTLEARGRGIVMTMGKGGVGKTSIAVAIAVELARRGHSVQLTTTDPAAHVADVLGKAESRIQVSRIDPELETKAYASEVMSRAGAGLDAAGRALLEEDLRSPCTEEIAVFRAFARTVADGERTFVVIDTAPTGHTLLLLDAAESFHREVLRANGDVPDEVRRLLPRLRDPQLTHTLIVTLPEATPVHEASQLQRDLQRAGIEPMAWVVNQSLLPVTVSDPCLTLRRHGEVKFLAEVSTLGKRVIVLPWTSRRSDARLDLVGASDRESPTFDTISAPSSRLKARFR